MTAGSNDACAAAANALRRRPRRPFTDGALFRSVLTGEA